MNRLTELLKPPSHYTANDEREPGNVITYWNLVSRIQELWISTLANKGEFDMRTIFALAAAALLAGCSQGKWHPENSTLSFSFDTASIGRTLGDTDGPKAMPPADREVGHLADAGIRPGR